MIPLIESTLFISKRKTAIEAMIELNREQEIAAKHVEGPLLVLAGAGSGKTRVVTFRIGYLLDLGVLPSDILAVTFTNKAADEMRTRIKMLKNAHVLACTFHSLGARILRESISAIGYSSDFAIYDEEDSEKLLKTCFEEIGVPEEKGWLRKTRHQISSFKNDLVDPDSAPVESKRIYQLYQQKLKECNALDFDDLLYLTVKLLKENEAIREKYQKRWLFVLIDEYQDTNLAQYSLAKILVSLHSNIFAVGDPDQSIYSWRGARYQNILNFESDFNGAKVVCLDQNYRSTNAILQGANGLIQCNSERFDKKLWSALGEGEKIGVYQAQNEREEAQFAAREILKASFSHPLNEMAIFYRTNAQSRIFEDALLSKKISYEIVGGVSFYQRKEIKDLLAYLKMALSNSDLISFLRTLHIPKRGLGMATVERLIQGADQKKIPIFTFCQHVLEKPDLCKLGPKQKEGLRDYIRTIERLREKKGVVSLPELIGEAISIVGYLNYLKEDPETFQDRKENIDQLVGKAAEWEEEAEEPILPRFLEELSLRTHREQQGNVPSVKLMTLHNSKGLEFEIVFLGGLEEDLFPHINSQEDPKAIEEERRLCYVGMTRAKKRLYLLSALYRSMWGAARLMRPSRFLKEIPSEYLQKFSPLSFSFENNLSPDGEKGEFSPGDEVLHQEFGGGIVQKAYRGSFGITYEIYFPQAETCRTLVAKYAKLQLIQKTGDRIGTE